MAAKKYSPKLKPISSAVHTVLVGAIVVSGESMTVRSAQAGDEPGIESTKRGYPIPAGPLGPASQALPITSFAEHGSLTLAYGAELAEEKAAEGGTETGFIVLDPHHRSGPSDGRCGLRVRRREHGDALARGHPGHSKVGQRRAAEPDPGSRNSRSAGSDAERERRAARILPLRYRRVLQRARLHATRAFQGRLPRRPVARYLFALYIRGGDRRGKPRAHRGTERPVRAALRAGRTRRHGQLRYPNAGLRDPIESPAVFRQLRSLPHRGPRQRRARVRTPRREARCRLSDQ